MHLITDQTTEARIKELNVETKQSVTEITEGSDEHLDLINAIKTILNSLTNKFHTFIESFFEKMNGYSNEYLESFLPKLKDFNISCLSLIGALDTTSLCKHMSSAVEDYKFEYSLLRELIHDIQIRISKDEELHNLLMDVNNA